ncbi:uncharacterized protein FTOL_05728 [Fusarium torulosum]|uniref:2EXR domain-containing protein n=1 Tax=Fusarium torulosum TaxID=33205 RepID=A0AAE8M807_9HYPO|nr:uncharacterized protein FTOL_05728 [Fusarium torulosum]
MASTGSPEETVRQHLQVPDSAPELASFSMFPKLPLEVRRLIWQQAMSYERNINIELFISYNLEDLIGNRQRASTENATPSEPALGRYTATVSDGTVMSVLFHTTSESRQEAKEFYHVRLHSVSFRGCGTTVKETLYLCPELDTINLNFMRGSLEGFEEFASDVWNNDPNKIGLVNIGISADITMDNTRLMAHRRPRRRQTLKECIERLERIMFVRVVPWDLSGTGYFIPGITGGEWNRSVPVTRKSGGVDCLETDPRPIRNDLRRVYLGPTDPRIAVHAWSYLLGILGISSENLNKNCSFRLCYDKRRVLHCLLSSQISQTDRRIAQEWMEGGLAYSRMRRREGEIPEELSEEPQLAIGFWLFPLESIGPLYEQTERNGGHDVGSPTPVEPEFHRVEDMTKYPPKLYLCHLPTK